MRPELRNFILGLCLCVWTSGCALERCPTGTEEVDGMCLRLEQAPSTAAACAGSPAARGTSGSCSAQTPAAPSRVSASENDGGSADDHPPSTGRARMDAGIGASGAEAPAAGDSGSSSASCAQKTVFWRDADGDGLGSDDESQSACAAPQGYVLQSGDCNDTNAEIHPMAQEACNMKDDNCDGSVDEGQGISCYVDADGDGVAAADANAVPTCGSQCPSGLVEQAPQTMGERDCDDRDRAVNPRGTETCNNKDDDCDGTVDDGLTRRCGSPGRPPCRVGNETCSAGQWGACDGVAPMPEGSECNSVDDDCDGILDQGNSSCWPSLSVPGLLENFVIQCTATCMFTGARAQTGESTDPSTPCPTGSAITGSSIVVDGSRVSYSFTGTTGAGGRAQMGRSDVTMRCTGTMPPQP
jgi:hypothetical protein